MKSQNGILRILLLIALVVPAEGQTPSSYTLNISIAADPARSLGSANGLHPMVVDLGGGNLAPGAFFAVWATAQFPDGRMAFTCGINPAFATVRLRYESGESLNLRPFRLPERFGTPRAGCEPLAAVLPQDAPVGQADLMFSYPQITGTLRVRIFPTWVALLTPLDQSLSKPYLSGDTVFLRTSGLGVTPLEEVTIVAGGIATPVISREPDPQDGFERIGFRMPEEAAESCYLPLYLRTATGETAPVFVPKANQPGPCLHPFHLDQEQLAALDDGRRVWTAQTALSIYERDGLVETTATFQQVERWRMASLAAPDDSRTCRILPLNSIVVEPGIMRSTIGTAGSALAVTSPSDQLQEVNLNPSTLTYLGRFSMPTPYAGGWTLRGPGGLDIGEFETRVDVPALPAWTPPERIDRASDLTITWNPEGLTSRDRFSIAVGSGFGPFIECRTTGDAGTLTIPSRVLNVLPANADGLISMGISRPPSERNVFSIPVLNGGSGVGIFDYRLVSTVRNLPIE